MAHQHVEWWLQITPGLMKPITREHAKKAAHSAGLLLVNFPSAIRIDLPKPCDTLTFKMSKRSFVSLENQHQAIFLFWRKRMSSESIKHRLLEYGIAPKGRLRRPQFNVLQKPVDLFRGIASHAIEGASVLDDYYLFPKDGGWMLYVSHHEEIILSIRRSR